MIGIVDLGVGNLGSVRNMFERLGHQVVASSDVTVLREVERLVLPGVGSFDRAAAVLNGSLMGEFLTERVLGNGVPILGICLGMQLLGRSSEEGDLKGLGWLPATVRRIRVPEDSELKVPHMGWNTVELRRPSPLLSGGGERFYFVHSYSMCCEDPDDVIATTHHGEEIVAAVGRGNVFGVQFHPEKSHRFGMALLNRFAAADPDLLWSAAPC
jgi:glutamine amidotransferase